MKRFLTLFPVFQKRRKYHTVCETEIRLCLVLYLKERKWERGDCTSVQMKDWLVHFLFIKTRINWKNKNKWRCFQFTSLFQPCNEYKNLLAVVKQSQLEGKSHIRWHNHPYTCLKWLVHRKVLWDLCVAAACDEFIVTKKRILVFSVRWNPEIFCS